MAAERPTLPPIYPCVIWGLAAAWTVIQLSEILSFLPRRGVTVEHQIAAGAMGAASILAGFVVAYASERFAAAAYRMRAADATARDRAGSAGRSSDSATG